MKYLKFVAAAVLTTGLTATLRANTVVQGFENGTGDWTGGTITRVNGPLTPAGGSWYANVGAQTYTYFDNPVSAIWTGPYTQSIDVFIDPSAGSVGDAWNFDMGIRRASDGTWLDDTGIGAGRVAGGWDVVGTGNGGAYTSGGTLISAAGWYTIGATWTAGPSFLTRHAFVEPLNGAEIYSRDITKNYQGLGLAPSAQPGGADYGWFSQMTLPQLSIDNATLTTAVPLPRAVYAGLGLLAGLALLGGLKRRQRRLA